MKVHKPVLFILLFGVFTLCNLEIASAYEFATDRIKLINVFRKNALDINRVRLALVFVNEGSVDLKFKTNLVNTKKEIANEMLKSFQVADPIIVNKVLKRNKLKPTQVISNPDLYTQFLQRVGASHMVHVSLRENALQLNTGFQVLTEKGKVLSYFEHEQAMETFNAKPAALPVDEKVGQEEFSVGESFFEKNGFSNFSAPLFTEGQNDAWMHFTPTALLIPKNHSLEVNLWMKDLQNTELPVKTFRYDGKAGKVQFGWQSYGSTEKEHHSSYYSIKFNAVDESVMPVHMTLGWRGRAYWNTKNEELNNEDEDIEDANHKQNKSALYLAVSGKLDNLGALLNFYLDNQSAALSGKLLLTSSVKIIAEGIYYYYPGDHITGDAMAGIELVSTEGTSFALTYQEQTQQSMLVSRFDW